MPENINKKSQSYYFRYYYRLPILKEIFHIKDQFTSIYIKLIN